MWFLFSWVEPCCVRVRYIMLFRRQRNLLYFVYLARHVLTLESHHQLLQIIYLQLLICNIIFALNTVCF
jgi:hypothetical protein